VAREKQQPTLDQILEAMEDGLQVNADDPRRKLAVDADTYAAVFGTPAGRLVLEDMTRQFVMQSRWNPGEEPAAGFMREGQAQVVFMIHQKLLMAEKGQDDG
jgi:hypothetical protein